MRLRRIVFILLISFGFLAFSASAWAHGRRPQLPGQPSAAASVAAPAASSAAETPAPEPPPPELGTGEVVTRFTYEGAVHLVTGYDHLLFVLSLLLAAGHVAARDGVKKALKGVALLVTAFTLGHSVTLVSAALDVVVLPSRLVESAIAASIVFVAALNIARPQTSAGRPWLALAFGLVHGFGFSSVLKDMGLPPNDRVLALLSFNIGIELAQLVFVGLAIVPLAWLAKQRYYERWVVQAGSVAIGCLALFWLVQRAFGLDA